MLRLLIRTIPLLATLSLYGCWHSPRPPSDAEISAYGWKANIELPTGSPYFRFALPDKIAEIARQKNGESFAIFDSAGNPQSCNALSASGNNLLAVVPRITLAHLWKYDSAYCGKSGIPLVCIKGQSCPIPDYCSPQIVDLTDTPLQGMDMAQIRAVLDSGSYEQRLSAKEFFMNVGDAGDFLPPTLVAATPQDRDLLATLVEMPAQSAQVAIQWNRNNPGSGTVKLTCRRQYGNNQDFGLTLQIGTAPAIIAGLPPLLGSGCASREFRLTLQNDVPANLDVRQVEVVSYPPKPFMNSSQPQYWFRAAGTAPYSLMVEPGRGGCGNYPDLHELAKLPHIVDPNWPPLASVSSTPTVIQRSMWMRLVAANNVLAAWLVWLAYVGGVCAVALLVTLARWIWLAERARR